VHLKRKKEEGSHKTKILKFGEGSHTDGGMRGDYDEGENLRVTRKKGEGVRILTVSTSIEERKRRSRVSGDGNWSIRRE